MCYMQKQLQQAVTGEPFLNDRAVVRICKDSTSDPKFKTVRLLLSAKDQSKIRRTLRRRGRPLGCP
jgi:hypothetical protein